MRTEFDATRQKNRKELPVSDTSDKTIHKTDADRALLLIAIDTTRALLLETEPTQIRNDMLVHTCHIIHRIISMMELQPIPQPPTQPTNHGQNDVGVPNEALIVTVRPETNPDLYPAILRIGPSRWKVAPKAEHIDSGPLP